VVGAGIRLVGDAVAVGVGGFDGRHAHHGHARIASLIVGAGGQGVVTCRTRHPGPLGVELCRCTASFTDEFAVRPELQEDDLAGQHAALNLNHDVGGDRHLLAVLWGENGDCRPGRIPPSDDQGRQDAAVGQVAEGAKQAHGDDKANQQQGAGQHILSALHVFTSSFIR
jgi:hypothetical protein